MVNYETVKKKYKNVFQNLIYIIKKKISLALPRCFHFTGSPKFSLDLSLAP